MHMDVVTVSLLISIVYPKVNYFLSSYNFDYCDKYFMSCVGI